jgi:hypothetical protein
VTHEEYYSPVTYWCTGGNVACATLQGPVLMGGHTRRHRFLPHSLESERWRSQVFFNSGCTELTISISMPNFIEKLIDTTPTLRRSLRYSFRYPVLSIDSGRPEASAQLPFLLPQEACSPSWQQYLRQWFIRTLERRLGIARRSQLLDYPSSSHRMTPREPYNAE